jgi:hypothetical protein
MERMGLALETLLMHSKCSTGTFGTATFYKTIHKGERSCSFPLDRFFEKKRRKKLLSSSTLSRALPTLPSGRVSQQKSPVNEAVEGVDDPAARWHGHYPPSPVGGSVGKNPLSTKR